MYASKSNSLLRQMLLGHLGRGTFGQVLKVRSAGNRAFALKVIRNRPAFLQQAEVEVELLRELRLPQPEGLEGEAAEAAREKAAAAGDARAMVVQLHEHFMHHGHLCLVHTIKS